MNKIIAKTVVNSMVLARFNFSVALHKTATHSATILILHVVQKQKRD